MTLCLEHASSPILFLLVLLAACRVHLRVGRNALHAFLAAAGFLLVVYTTLLGLRYAVETVEHVWLQGLVSLVPVTCMLALITAGDLRARPGLRGAAQGGEGAS
jgi:hypothetical protein